MPLFELYDGLMKLVLQRDFSLEREIHDLIERNIETVFSCRLVAREFPTTHGGRIDTLAITEDGNPAIIEYKKVESSELVTQSLFYLHWLNDHRGDFQIAAQARLGHSVTVDWSDIRVICIAPAYRKFDLHAVQVMGANIELWRYRLFENNTLMLEEVFRRGQVAPKTRPAPAAIAAKPLPSDPDATGEQDSYTFDEHLADVPEAIRSRVLAIRELCLGLSESVEEAPKKFYIAYKVAKNFVCLQVQKKRILLYLKLSPADFAPLPANCRDVTDIGHYGTGDLECTVESDEHMSVAGSLINAAFQRTGGS